MRKEDEKQEENLGTMQKDIEEAAGKVAYSTKYDRDKSRERNTGECENTRRGSYTLHESDQAASEKARADQLVQCSLMLAELRLIAVLQGSTAVVVALVVEPPPSAAVRNCPFQGRANPSRS